LSTDKLSWFQVFALQKGVRSGTTTTDIAAETPDWQRGRGDWVGRLIRVDFQFMRAFQP
jgi:hypothetical protein